MTSWFINFGDLIFTQAKGKGECKISRVDKSWCQLISKVNKCVIEINVKNYLFPFTGGSHLQINTTVIVNEIKEWSILRKPTHAKVCNLKMRKILVNVVPIHITIHQKNIHHAQIHVQAKYLSIWIPVYFCRECVIFCFIFLHSK